MSSIRLPLSSYTTPVIGLEVPLRLRIGLIYISTDTVLRRARKRLYDRVGYQVCSQRAAPAENVSEADDDGRDWKATYEADKPLVPGCLSIGGLVCDMVIGECVYM